MGHALHHALEPSTEYNVDLTVTAGRWPDGLTGSVFVIGPAQPTAVDFMFAGPGLLTQVDLETRHWRTKRVVTPDLALLDGLGRALPPAELAELTAGGRPSLTNVAPHFFGDRLLLTGLSQRPVEFDPATLEFRTFLGGVGEYPEVVAHPLLPGVRTAAHPVEDLDDGCMWWCNTNLRPRGSSTTDMEGPMWVVRWDGHGDVETWHVPGAHLTQGVHEMTVTQDYVIFTEIGFQPEPGAVAGRGRTKPHLPFTDVYLVAKRDLTAARRGSDVPVTHARVPRESFHHFADYRQDGDDVTMYLAHSNGWDLNYTLTDADSVWGTGSGLAKGLPGFVPAPVDASPVGRYVIDGRTGRVRDSRVFLDAERHWATLVYGRDLRRPGLERGRHLWQSYWGCDTGMLATRVVEMYRDHPYRVVPVDRLPSREIPSSLVCIDLETMTEQSAWSFPAGTTGESPVFVPDPAGGPGWAVIFVHHSDRTELQVFDALALGAGPVAVATAAGLKLSVQFHSGYLPDIRLRDTGYERSFAADLGDDWRQFSPAARGVISQVLEQYG
ncbi:carotenoid oxygenase family protein [Parafrankia discariae]|uniref:carotenoid oxygenase family protein n=1 Tax=Parafrankia discariae TaxID=365528 RepID=UPI00036DE024|nr:carotenoid oxygenase family protein [Parafrankia discariae]